MNSKMDVVQVVRERIAKKAFELYQQRDQCSAHEIDDWAEAERSIFTELVSLSSTKPKTSRRKAPSSNNSRNKSTKRSI